MEGHGRELVAIGHVQDEMTLSLKRPLQETSCQLYFNVSVIEAF
jgi:hypothetical protein